MSLFTLALLSILAAKTPLDAHRIQTELQERFEIAPSQIEFSDEFFVVPSHEWIVESFIPFARNYLKANRLSAVGEGMDCDNLAQIYKQQLSISNALGGRAKFGDVPCALIKTRQINDFGGVSGDGRHHSLLILRTNRGWHALEPQTGEIAPLSEYPNRLYLEWALF